MSDTDSTYWRDFWSSVPQNLRHMHYAIWAGLFLWTTWTLYSGMQFAHSGGHLLDLLTMPDSTSRRLAGAIVAELIGCACAVRSRESLMECFRLYLEMRAEGMPHCVAFPTAWGD